MKYVVIYSDSLEEGFGARCYYPVFPKWGTCKVVIRHKYKDDMGLLNHELKHVEQYSGRLLHSLMYRFSKRYRYECELEAYKAQIVEYKYKTIGEAMWIANALFSKYDLDIELEDVINKVTEIVGEQNE